jgi:hypothetical protein
VPELAAGPRLLAVQVHVRAGDWRSIRSSGGASPIRFTIATARRFVDPSGRPRIARRWFSNWLVRAPSIVQWPELWHARRDLVREQAAARARTARGRARPTYVERVEQPARVVLGHGLRVRRPGARDVRRIPSRCTFSTSGRTPSRPGRAHGQDGQLAPNATICLRDLVLAQVRRGS